MHKYTVQCVLPYNLFYEKIYIFLWWWLVFVIAMSCVGVLVWFLTLLPKSNTRYCMRLRQLGSSCLNFTPQFLSNLQISDHITASYYI